MTSSGDRESSYYAASDSAAPAPSRTGSHRANPYQSSQRYNTVPYPTLSTAPIVTKTQRYSTASHPVSATAPLPSAHSSDFQPPSQPPSLYNSPVSQQETLTSQLTGLTLYDGVHRAAAAQANSSQAGNVQAGAFVNPPRPPLLGPLFSQPYVAPPHPPQLNGSAHLTPQFEQACQPVQQYTPGKDAPGLLPPEKFERPVSAPPGRFDDWQSSFPKDSPPSTPTASRNRNHEDLYGDDKKSGIINRFVGNMLPMRVGRAGLQSIVSTAKLPAYLSPWGDNTPVVLPNIRKRDIAMTSLSHVTWGALSPGALSVLGKTFEHSMKFTAEQAVEQSIHRVVGSNHGHRVKKRTGINSLQLRIKHKLIGEDAEIALFGERPAMDKRSCAKAWLCPYLYASGRTPQIARSKDFTMAQFVGPGLAADAAVAPTLLTTLTETSTPIISLCPWEAIHPSFPRFRRMGVFLLGISPVRKSWSQSRIPNEARFSCHLFTHVPALVVPIKEASPVLAWSPWTLELMTLHKQVEDVREGKDIKGSKIDMDLAYGELPHYKALGQQVIYSPQTHCEELLDYLHNIIDRDIIEPTYRNQWRMVLRAAIESVVNEAIRTYGILGHDLGGICDMNRAGISLFRY